MSSWVLEAEQNASLTLLSRGRSSQQLIGNVERQEVASIQPGRAAEHPGCSREPFGGSPRVLQGKGDRKPSAAQTCRNVSPQSVWLLSVSMDTAEFHWG